MCRFFFFEQKTAYEVRISDWSSDVCSSDLGCIDASSANICYPCNCLGSMSGRPSGNELGDNGFGAIMDLNGMAAVITGGESGIGAASAIQIEIGRASGRERGCQYV